MTAARRYFPLIVWAARDVQRRPGRALLFFVCLLSLVFLTATPLLFSQALDSTWTRLTAGAPDLVVRRIDAGGWAPLTADAAVAAARKIPGVIAAVPRLWGVAAAPGGPVMVVASTAVIPEKTLQEVTPPSIGQAVVGQKVIRGDSTGRLTLVGHRRIRLQVSDTFPPHTGLATHDAVWITAADARQLMGLMPEQASDLAVHLFRREEARAVEAELADAFPWPVSITSRDTTALGHHIQAVRTGGIATVACIPALLALLLLITGIGAGSGRRAHWGLQQALGWTLGDLVRLQTAKAMIVGLPAVAAGMASAYAAVFYPPMAGITASWITGGRRLPVLVLDTNGVAAIMIEVAAMVVLPCLAAVFLTCLRSTAGDPWRSMQAAPWN